MSKRFNGMNQRGNRQVLGVSILLWLILAFGGALADARPGVRTSMMPVAGYRPLLRSTRSAALPGSGVTAQRMSFDFGEDENVATYGYMVTVLDDTHPADGDGNRPADTLYDGSNAGRTSDHIFQYTFYLPGTYGIYAFRYDSEGEPVSWQNGEESYEFIYHQITIVEGGGDNPLRMKVAEVAAACRRDSEYETALAINDWLCAHVTYDESFMYYSPEAALLQGTCVCNGYSRAYNLIAEEAGLSCRRVAGKVPKYIDPEEGGHAWNVVSMDGNWYYVDSTWNDGSRPDHHYFGMNQVIMDYDHTITNVVGGAVSCTELADSYYIRSGKWKILAQDILTEMNAAVRGRCHLFNAVSMGEAIYDEFDRPYGDDAQKLANGHVTAYAFNRQEWICEETGESFQTDSFVYDFGTNTISGEFAAEGTVSLPDGLEHIKSQAFAGTGAYYAVIPEGCRGIGAEAFSGSRLWEIFIPASVTEIDGRAFDGTLGLVVRTPAGSPAVSLLSGRSGLTLIEEN